MRFGAKPTEFSASHATSSSLSPPSRPSMACSASAVNGRSGTTVCMLIAIFEMAPSGFPATMLLLKREPTRRTCQSSPEHRRSSSECESRSMQQAEAAAGGEEAHIRAVWVGGVFGNSFRDPPEAICAGSSQPAASKLEVSPATNERRSLNTFGSRAWLACSHCAGSSASAAMAGFDRCWLPPGTSACCRERLSASSRHRARSCSPVTTRGPCHRDFLVAGSHAS